MKPHTTTYVLYLLSHNRSRHFETHQRSTPLFSFHDMLRSPKKNFFPSDLMGIFTCSPLLIEIENFLVLIFKL